MYIYDAFSDQVGGGNRTALVEASSLSGDEMQAIATELGYAETLFYNGLKLRYFSPQEEIDFCGHATLAFIWHRGQTKKTDQEVLSTPVGDIPVFYSYQEEALEKVWMLQSPHSIENIDFEIKSLLEALGLDESDLDLGYPLMRAYTGNWDLFVPVKNAAAIDGLVPRMEELAELNRDMEVLSTHLYTMEAGEDYDIYTRDFAPACGIPEDPVTGSANGALFALLLEKGFISEEDELVFAQGHALGYRGRVLARFDRDSARVLVGGKAVLVSETHS